MALACIGLGGCSLFGYAGYGCAPPGAAAYYPYGCYGAYCRHRLKGSRLLALNESGGDNGGTAAAEGGFTREGQEGSNPPETAAEDNFGALQASPDALFLECCQSWSLPAQCLRKCSFGNYSAETLRSMFLRSDDCPIESASIIHFCASQNQDHKSCCAQAGIDKTRAGDKCLVFCEQMPQNETRLDLSYLPCFERFSAMKKCFYENALRTIDYLEAELEEIRREKGKEEQEKQMGLDTDGGGDNFAIGRPPIIFVNDLRPKHPQINDGFQQNEQQREGAEEERGGAEQRN